MKEMLDKSRDTPLEASTNSPLGFKISLITTVYPYIFLHLESIKWVFNSGHGLSMSVSLVYWQLSQG